MKARQSIDINSSTQQITLMGVSNFIKFTVLQILEIKILCPIYCYELTQMFTIACGVIGHNHCVIWCRTANIVSTKIIAFDLYQQCFNIIWVDLIK